MMENIMPLLVMMWIVQISITILIHFYFKDQTNEINKRFDELEEKLKQLK